MRHIRLTLEYDGTGLGGWQRQSNAPTVQGHLEDALATLLQHPVTTSGASRTDAGVHALGQVAKFETERPIPLHGIRRGLNTLMPPAISVTAAVEVGPDFHPRFSATGKRYRYRLVARPSRAPLWRGQAWHVAPALDRAAMAEAAAALLGERDFAAFRSAGCTASSTTRRIDAIDLVEPEPGLLDLFVRGNAFLRQQVRILTGTLVDVGLGRLTPAQVVEIIEGRDRRRAGPTAPPHGLALVEVFYDGTRPPYRPGRAPAVPEGAPTRVRCGGDTR